MREHFRYLLASLALDEGGGSVGTLEFGKDIDIDGVNLYVANAILAPHLQLKGAGKILKELLGGDVEKFEEGERPTTVRNEVNAYVDSGPGNIGVRAEGGLHMAVTATPRSTRIGVGLQGALYLRLGDHFVLGAKGLANTTGPIGIHFGAGFIL